MAADAFDASSEPPAPYGEGPPQPPENRGTRPFVGVHFQCCSVYSRVYLKPAEQLSIGFCPRCGRRIEFLVSERTGSAERFFTVY
jgi:hypothetical protein